MMKYHTYHSDEKPMNFVLDSSEDLPLNLYQLCLFMIDFGTASFSFDQNPTGFSKFFAPNDFYQKILQ